MQYNNYLFHIHPLEESFQIYQNPKKKVNDKELYRRIPTLTRRASGVKPSSYSFQSSKISVAT